MESIHLEKKNVMVKFLWKWWQRDLQWSYTVNQDDKTSGDDLDTSENNEIGLFSKVILYYTQHSVTLIHHSNSIILCSIWLDFSWCMPRLEILVWTISMISWRPQDMLCRITSSSIFRKNFLDKYNGESLRHICK